MGCGPSRSAIHPATVVPWNQYRLLRNVEVDLQYGSWTPNNGASNANAVLPPPYSEVVPDGHVSLGRRCNIERTSTDWQAEPLTEVLSERLASLQTTDTHQRINNRTERSSTGQRRKQQRRATRSAPDISIPTSRCSTPSRRGRVSPFPEQSEETAPENPWPNRRHSRQALGRTTVVGIGTTLPHSESRSLSPPIRSPEAVRVERIRRKRMRRRLTPQRLDFGRGLEGRRCSDGALLPQQTILERNRSVPEFSPFVMSITPTFQFGTPVRQRSTSALLPLTPVSFLENADTDQEISCNTTSLYTPEPSDTTDLERVSPRTVKSQEQLPRLAPQRPSIVPSTPFKVPNFSRSKLPPIKDMPQRSRNVVWNNSAATASREPGDLPQAETSKA